MVVDDIDRVPMVIPQGEAFGTAREGAIELTQQSCSRIGETKGGLIACNTGTLSALENRIRGKGE